MIEISSDADRVRWREKYLRYLLAHLDGREQISAEAVRVTNLTWHKAHQEGLEDAIALIFTMAKNRPRAEQELLESAADAIEALRAKDDVDTLAAYGQAEYRANGSS
jgi:hypothetical protein